MTAPLTTPFITRLTANLDDATRVVLLYAWHREDLGADTLALIVRHHYGDAAVARVEEIADALDWALRLGPGGYEPFADVLRELTGAPHIGDAESMAAQLAEEKECDAVSAAQLVASLVRPARTAVA